MSASGRIDLLINNAAIFATIPISRVPLEQISLEEWDRVMAVNLRGIFLACRAVLPAMRQQGYGKIINISSSTVMSGSPTRIHYVTSKAGVLGFTRTLASELGQYGITVNCVAPGVIKTRFAEALWGNEEIRRRVVENNPMGRIGEPMEVAGAVVFLASDAASYINGEVLVIDGGGPDFA